MTDKDMTIKKVKFPNKIKEFTFNRNIKINEFPNKIKEFAQYSKIKKFPKKTKEFPPSQTLLNWISHQS